MPPTQMRAQIIESFNTPYVLTTVNTPQIKDPNDVLVKLHAAGYCHTDGMMCAGACKPDPPKFPHINSHEIAGEIVALHDSPSRYAAEYQIGERVISTGRPFHPCGECFECVDTTRPDHDDGYSIVCPYCEFNGMSKDGGFAEFVVVDARQLAKIPDNISATDAAPLSCAGITIYGALKRTGIQAGQRVAIIGAGGGLGHLGLQFADALGFRTLGVDAADGPLELARSLGSNAMIVDARKANGEDIKSQMGKEDGKSHRDEMGVDAAVILVESQAGFDFGFNLVKNHGTVVVVSYGEKGFRVSSRDLVYRDIRIVGTILGSIKTLREMMDVVAKHNVKPVTTAFPFGKLNELVDEYHKGKGGKFVVEMSGST
ncbi:alcohol dehydrogenase [Pseudocercospora fuligena]|uniref:Alcohol dehydrogenase n=1 Tax=Pseudocercospora fuligena TaxID=685502 RepID=A0A8H6RKQ9_9PEZI|nr:alcohol dehydrogenase [Pseudocercospora fuligena]